MSVKHKLLKWKSFHDEVTSLPKNKIKKFSRKFHLSFELENSHHKKVFLFTQKII